MSEIIYTNSTIVTRNQVFNGTVIVKNGIIKTVDDCIYRGKNAFDLKESLLLPGLIELHTDNLEKNIQPRPGVIWPSIMASTIAHDIQIIGSGITTVFDAVAVGGLRQSSLRSQILGNSIAALHRGKELKIYKADHFIHLRCEISDSRMEEMLFRYGTCPAAGLVSIMDHTPGQRQWKDIEKWKLYHRDKKWTKQETETILSDLQEMQDQYAEKNRKTAIRFALGKNLPLASHDDTTENDAETAAEEGVTIAEFPTTLEAASKAKTRNMSTVMGAPNAVRGTSHSGNVSASVLAEKGLLDGMSSDYVPASLLHAAFHLADTYSLPLNKTVAMVSANVADMVGLKDRGEIAPGKIADMLQVSRIDNLPVIRKVWKEGIHIA